MSNHDLENRRHSFNTPVITQTQLYIQEHRSDILTHYRQQATQLKEQAISHINVLYIMDIQDLDPVYRSLILDHHGNAYLAKKRSNCLANQYCQHIRFNYKTWLSYLQYALDQSKMQFPFVYFGQIIIPIKGSDSNGQKDWLNVSHCHLMQIKHADNTETMPYRLQNGDQIIFHFLLQMAGQPCLQIIINQKPNDTYNQIRRAYDLSKDWFNYQDMLLLHAKVNYQLDRSPAYLNPIFIYESDNASRTHYHLTCQNLADFEHCESIQTYLSSTQDARSQRLSHYLERHHLDLTRIKESLLYYHDTYPFK